MKDLYIPSGPVGWTRKGRPIFPIAGGANVATLDKSARPVAPTAMGTQPRPDQEAAAGQLVRPFIKASRERTLMGPSGPTLNVFDTQSQGPYDLEIPAGGFLRGLHIDVTATGGSDANADADQDGPFSVLQNVTLQDVNGNILVGPFSGFELYLIEKYGGYWNMGDAKLKPSYTAVAVSGNFAFSLYIPVEISGRDGYGSLPNQNSSQTFKLQYQIGTLAQVYGTNVPAAGEAPDLAISVGLDIWDQPPPTGPRGEANEQMPPGLGATQYWRPSTYTLPSGNFTQRFGRVGNNIRNLILVHRNTSDSLRSTTNFPSTYRLQIDDKAFDHNTRARLRDRMAKQYGYGAAADAAEGLDTGVFVWNFDHDLDGKPGFSNRHGLLETHEGTKLEILGDTGAAATLKVITNDIASQPSSEVYGRL